jgi:succinoglycan biosynthesis protein ExoA
MFKVVQLQFKAARVGNSFHDKITIMNNVSIIIPCYNEEKTITKLLSGLYEQTLPHSSMEIIIADGLSTDDTREKIAEFCIDHPDLKILVIDNPQKTIPSGLNLAINAAKGEFIVRLDAHSIPAIDYIEKCVADLEKNLGNNVGGIWIIQPGNNSWIAESIAKAASSSIGVGNANYRLNSRSGEVDTVPFGSFRKSYLLSVGGFDENLLTNEDYELNSRIRKNGGKIWLDNSIRSTYFARPTFKKLASQYWRYGWWKAQMLKQYPNTIKWRQALPPLFVLGLVIILVLSIFQPLYLTLFFTIILSYILILFVYSWFVGLINRKPSFIFGIPCAIIIMHMCWGSGLLFGLFTRPQKSGITDKLVG